MSHPTAQTSLPRSMPEEQGLPSRSILAFLDALQAARFNLHSLMLVRHGRVIAEGWWAPFDPGCRRYIYSLSKSFTSTAVGFAVQERLLSVDDRVVSFFPDDLPQRLDENLAAMRVKDLLTMTTGHAIDTTIMVIPQGLVNWAQSILSVSADFPPGSHFLYNTGATYLLSCIVTRLTGQTLLDYLAPRLFEPLGIAGATWDTCPRGISTGGWGLSVRTEDLARFGQFYLQKGRWNGRQLLSPAWIEEATRLQVRNDLGERAREPVDWRQGYGYQFWRCQHGAYRADGASGQFCVVMPRQEAVLAITSETQDMQGVLDRVWEHLLPVMQDGPVAPQRVAQAELQERLASLHMAHPPSQPLPQGIAGLSGRRYRIGENAAGVQEVSFSFTVDGCDFRLWDEAGEHRVACGNGNWVRSQAQVPLMQPSLFEIMLNRKPHSPVKVAAHGEWTDPRTYLMTWQYLETPHSSRVTCRFEGRQLRIEVTSSMEDPANPFLAGRETHLSGALAEDEP